MEAEKNGRKGRKALYKLINNTLYGKKVENLRNRFAVRLGRNKRLFKTIQTIQMDIKSRLYVTKIFDDDSVSTRKIKVI